MRNGPSLASSFTILSCLTPARTKKTGQRKAGSSYHTFVYVGIVFRLTEYVHLSLMPVKPHPQSYTLHPEDKIQALLAPTPPKSCPSPAVVPPTYPVHTLGTLLRELQMAAINATPDSILIDHAEHASVRPHQALAAAAAGANIIDPAATPHARAPCRPRTSSSTSCPCVRAPHLRRHGLARHAPSRGAVSTTSPRSRAACVPVILMHRTASTAFSGYWRCAAGARDGLRGGLPSVACRLEGPLVRVLEDDGC